MKGNFLLCRNIVGFIRVWKYYVNSYSLLARIERRNPIFVYQMGKVGSSTVVRTLENAGIDPVFHLHTLSNQGIRHAISRCRQSTRPYLDKHLILSRALRRRLDKRSIPCRIITLTREPISRAISFVFEDRAKQVPDAILEDGRIDVDKVNARLSIILSEKNGTADPTIWFDQELRGVFGVDVFSQPYDFERGYSILKESEVEVLVIRMEDLNRSLIPALSSLLGVDPTTLVVSNSNEGENKSYAMEMEMVKRSFKVTPSVAKCVLSTRYFEHFYGPERETIMKRWVGSIEAS